jgi:hypothetical protein
MRTKNVLLLLAIIGVIFTSCRRVSFTAGDLTSEDRIVDTNFTKIDVSGSIDVIITQDPAYQVRVEAGNRMMDFIETDVTGGELRIWERSNSIINDKPMRVYVSIGSVERLTLEGSGSIEGSNLVANNCEIDVFGSGDVVLDIVTTSMSVAVDGSGDIEVGGTTQDFVVDIRGSGDVNARFFESDDCSVFIQGSGDARVHANQSLDVTIDGSGDVLYWGNPSTVNSNITGSGDLIQMQ